MPLLTGVLMGYTTIRDRGGFVQGCLVGTTGCGKTKAMTTIQEAISLIDKLKKIPIKSSHLINGKF